MLKHVKTALRPLKPALCEARIHYLRLTQPRHAPRLLVSVSGGRDGMASELRGWNVADQLRKRGWRVSVIPAELTLSQRRRLVRLERPDLVLLQKARHPLNRPSTYAGIPCIFDLDDADFIDERLHDQIVECCSQSINVIAGSRYIADWVRQHNPEVTRIWTGMQVPKERFKPGPGDRDSVVCWACSDPGGYPNEAALVGSFMPEVLRRTSARFWLFGVRDHQWAQSWLQTHSFDPDRVRIFPYMSLENFRQQLASVAVGLAPLLPEADPYSRGKSFGKILSYLTADVPIVASHAVDHPLFFEHGRNGFLAKSPDDWIEHICRLVTDPALRDRIANSAYHDFLARLSIDKIQ